jgi:hypothetical protein
VGADEDALAQAVTAAHEGRAHKAASRLEEPSGLGGRRLWLGEAVQAPEGKEEIRIGRGQTTG